MTETPEKNSPEATDYKDTVFLPKTDFPMKAGLPQKEPAILAKWQEQDLYRKLRDARAGREKFILHDGPPYANGDMHIGHALNHILKDMVVRTQSLLGKDAPYVPGWDCHGLPIEWKVEEQYRKKKLNKDEVPVEEFRAECRAYAKQWVDVQREQLKRLGVNADWDNPYLTMDFEAEATIVTELMKFAESGQLYRGAKPVMWSPVEKTALAEAEVEYEDITSTQIDVAFEIVESPISELVGAHAVIWTTTPWTIPVNQAIAYGADVEYDLYEVVIAVHPNEQSDFQANVIDAQQSVWFNGLRVICAKSLARGGAIPIPNQNSLRGRMTAEAYKLTQGKPWQPIVHLMSKTEEKGFKGSDLAGTMVRHPMWHLENPPRNGEGDHEVVEGALGEGSAGHDGGPPPSAVPAATSPFRGGFLSKPRPFLPGDFVTTETGTGLVHMSPDHGEDDFDLCKANGIEPVFAVEGDGKYRADWAWLGGQGSVINRKFNAPDGPICSDLREAGGLLAASADYKHSYPHSWRSKAKVIYRCTPQWFVPMGEAGGLRDKALTAIADTRWVPEKGRNRINSMVEGRPDWVLSRQRAWGVPITLFVDRKTGAYLCDAAVNARIIAGVREHGVDAWSDEAAQGYLGADYNLADYERVADILDVWFDSGCTHAFVLESGRWPDLTRPADYIGPWADLYLEGSDQHRGWFQSSLLESSGTRGHAPYKAVLTHGFTMDQKGMKMSKSLGNTINPIKIMENSGADIIRLWALSVDYTEDHRIGDEILKGVSDQYRKLRNTFRYMLGALDGFSEAERVDTADMPELERYVLHLLAELDAKLRQAVEDYDFNTYTRLLSEFANNDLSAFFFDIRKDCLYCDAVTNPKRMAYRTVLDILFHAMVRYAAPVLVFTAEEVWTTRFGEDASSVHLLEWPELSELRHSREGGERSDRKVNPSPVPSSQPEGHELDPRLRGGDEFKLKAKWADIRTARSLINEAIEPYRRGKTIGSSLQAEVILSIKDDTARNHCLSLDMAEISITSACIISAGDDDSVIVQLTTNHKCGRCWRHLTEVTEDGALCARCEDVIGA